MVAPSLLKSFRVKSSLSILERIPLIKAEIAFEISREPSSQL